MVSLDFRMWMNEEKRGVQITESEKLTRKRGVHIRREYIILMYRIEELKNRRCDVW